LDSPIIGHLIQKLEGKKEKVSFSRVDGDTLENLIKKDEATVSKLSDKEKETLKPLADRVLVEPLEAETKTASGIIIPDTAKEKPQKGNVVAVGAGTKDNPITVKVGQTVLYGKYSGTELKLDGNDYLIMRESDILAIV
jgi:chaperonin GroES